MKLNQWLVFLVVFPALLFIAGCDKQDEDIPSIDSITINGVSDEDHYIISAGESNEINVLLSDNGDLSQLKIQFVSITGFHSHSEGEDQSLMEKTFQSPNLGKWDTLAIYNLSGSNAHEIHSFTPPDTVSGGWKMSIAAMDTQGNAVQQDFTIHLYNDDMPKILPDSTVPAADSLGVIHLGLNQTVRLYGDFVDQDSLKKIETTLLQGGDTVWTQTSNVSGTWTLPMELIMLPDFTEEGFYLLRIHAWDMEGWSNWKQVRIEVEE